MSQLGGVSEKVKSNIDLSQQNLDEQIRILEKQQKLYRQSERALMPLSDLYFSFDLTYHNADEAFPYFYKLMDSVYRNTDFIASSTGFTCRKGEKTLKVNMADISRISLTSFLGNEIQAVFASINFCRNNSPDDRELQYQLYASIPSFNFFDELQKITRPYKKTLYEIEVNFEDRTLTQKINLASYSKTDYTHTLVSSADVLYPDDAKNKIITFQAPSLLNNYPVLSNLTIHFGENYSSVSIENSLLKKMERSSFGNLYSIQISEIQDYLKKNGMTHKVPGSPIN